MAGQTAAIRRLQSGVPLTPAELLEIERLLDDHVRRHGGSGPVQTALDDVRARIDRTGARAAVAADQAATRAATAPAAGEQRVGGTVRREAFGGVRFDGDLRPPRGTSRGRTGAVLLVAAVAAGIVGVVALDRRDESVTAGAGNTPVRVGTPPEVAAGPAGPADSGAQAGGPLPVSRAEFAGSGRDWPLTVDAGTLACEPAGSVVFTADGGGSYAVNGTAMTHTSWPDIDAVWSDVPGQPGLKVDIGDLIEAGLALC